VGFYKASFILGEFFSAMSTAARCRRGARFDFCDVIHLESKQKLQSECEGLLFAIK